MAFAKVEGDGEVGVLDFVLVDQLGAGSERQIGIVGLIAVGADSRDIPR